MRMGHPPFIPYRRGLKKSAQSLRRDPTPAERKLWFEFLRDLPVRFTRQKPLGQYIADFYCASRLLVIEIDGDSHFSEEGENTIRGGPGCWKRRAFASFASRTWK